MPERSIQDPRLAQAVRCLVEGLHPRAIILFGSRARGTNRAESDYGLLVVSERVLDYDQVYRPVSGRGLRCDIVPCTVDAWREAHLDAGGVLRDAFDDGIILYGQPRRVAALLEMTDEDLAGASALLDISTRLARYYVQQSAEKAVKALLELPGLNPGREHRFESLAEMLPHGDQWRGRIQSLDSLSPAAPALRYATTEGRIMPPPARKLVEEEIGTVVALIEDVKRAPSELSG